MAITNASRIADFGSGASSTNPSVIQVDYTNQRVGIGTNSPTTTLQVAGIVSATSFSGNITGTASSASFATTAYGLSGTPNLNVGVVTATSFVGSGSSLTGITGKAAAMAIVFGG
jgi:hypothetical protein